ncbi:MAG TPA: hypothetical protein VGQ96_06935 [Candidatus Eremiobacteraceae bacterium]|nr:hypothetical protein [Candidatus Eremiobacteraceae bacterium]
MNAKRTARRAVKDVADAARETSHRAKAGIERGKRTIAGDAMTTRQKAKSTVHEAGHRTAASFDRAKRKLRDAVE